MASGIANSSHPAWCNNCDAQSNGWLPRHIHTHTNEPNTPRINKRTGSSIGCRRKYTSIVISDSINWILFRYFLAASTHNQSRLAPLSIWNRKKFAKIETCILIFLQSHIVLFIIIMIDAHKKYICGIFLPSIRRKSLPIPKSWFQSNSVNAKSLEF